MQQKAAAALDTSIDLWRTGRASRRIYWIGLPFVIMEQVMDLQPQCVFVANGEMRANQVRAFLEAAGIATAVRGESLRHTHGLTLDGLGAVEILVAGADVDEARSLLNSAESGELRLR